MSKWNQLASKENIDKTINALEKNGIDVHFVQTGKEAKKKVLELIPEGSEVMTMTSVTLDTIGVSEEINKKDGKFKPVRDKLYANDGQSQQDKNKLAGAPEFVLGSVHAITKEGNVLIASNTGSQLGAHAYGALKAIWVVGAQKIVEDTTEGMKRIYEYVLPLESERARKAYGVEGSNVSKLLIINKEVSPGRVQMILVNETLGF